MNKLLALFYKEKQFLGQGLEGVMYHKERNALTYLNTEHEVLTVLFDKKSMKPIAMDWTTNEKKQRVWEQGKEGVYSVSLPASFQPILARLQNTEIKKESSYER